MKKSIIIAILVTFTFNSGAQNNTSEEKYGNTINLGAGMGYYGYVGHTIPAVSVNFELGVAHNFTLAPFIAVYSFREYNYWGNPDLPHNDPSYHYYSYRTIAVPTGIKGTYYFDELFHANPKWDFYAAASIGFIFRDVVWESGYNGDKRVYQYTSPLYLDAHIGAEYHLNNKEGLFVDLSTGVSTFGLAVHF